MATRRSERLKRQAESAPVSYDESVETPPAKLERKTEPTAVQTDFLSLNDDCLYTIFENLSLDDICAMSETCQRLYKVCATHFQRYHKEKVLIFNNVRKDGSLENQPKGEKYVNAFAKNIRNVTFGQSFAVKANLEQLHTFYETQEVASIKELRFNGWGLCPTQSRWLSNLVGDVESVTFSNTKIGGDLNECALQFMPKLKELTLSGMFDEPKDSSWMNQTYPTLERFSLHLEKSLPLTKIKHFLCMNPKIKIFSLRLRSHNAIKQLVRESIRIDELFFDIFSVSELSESLDDLLVLCQQQPCRLHLKLSSSINYFRTFFGKVVLLAPYIEGLYFESILYADIANVLVRFENLKVLKFTISAEADVISRIPNLQEIYADWGAYDSRGIVRYRYREALMIYARRSPKLKKIYVRNDPQTIDKFGFNEINAERRLLPGAEKLKIYFRTDEPHDTMRKLNEFQRNFDMIEIVHVESEIFKNPLITEYLRAKPLNQLW